MESRTSTESQRTPGVGQADEPSRWRHDRALQVPGPAGARPTTAVEGGGRGMPGAPCGEASSVDADGTSSEARAWRGRRDRRGDRGGGSVARARARWSCAASGRGAGAVVASGRGAARTRGSYGRGGGTARAAGRGRGRGCAGAGRLRAWWCGACTGSGGR
ncbi:uncharacterized protein [Miscanthus floridulus]|uniref:uncharacterized protein n=1 Tax=Miscanthus floridulus TaxID=154761 RepID=UPI00345A1645